MKYNESHLDRNLRSWFENDNTHQLLRSINLSEGSLRGLTKCRLDIDFPILAIAGRNGVGKSTMLALASCAFHGKKDFFKLPNRRMPYYTFADFLYNILKMCHQKESAFGMVLLTTIGE